MLALTDTRAQYQQLASTYLIVGLVVFGLVVLALVFLVLRYRVRKRQQSGPSRTHNNLPLELGYTAILVGVTAWLVTISFKTLDNINHLTPAAATSPQAVHIEVVAAQWNWRFVYPGRRPVQLANSALDPTYLYVPTNTLINFTGHSQDVLHDFWIPTLRYQHQVWPDHEERWGMVFPRAGRYEGLCAWFCGLYHQNMHFVVIAMAPQRFQAWLRTKRAEAPAV